MTLYHVSEDILNSIMIPRIPESDYEDQSVPRICFAPTIQGCIIGAFENEDITGKILHVYYIKTNDFYVPDIDQVADQRVTGEVWITYPVIPNYLCSIKITGIDKYNKVEIAGNKFEVPEYRYRILDKLEGI